MVSIALNISEEFKKIHDVLPWVNWSELARESFFERLKRDEAWEEAERIVSKSKLTEEQAMKLSDKVNWSLARRYKELLKRKK